MLTTAYHQKNISFSKLLTLLKSMVKEPFKRRTIRNVRDVELDAHSWYLKLLKQWIKANP
jgi:hypothetical protein